MNKNKTNLVRKENTKFEKNQLIILAVILIVGFSIRLYYYEPDIPFALDNLVYFSYSADISINGELPNYYSPANNGWPSLVGLIFSMFEFNEPIQYMQLQKLISISFSSITPIPIFFLCRYFFGNQLSLIGASFFAFEPRIIQNSLVGITEPLYIFLIVVVLMMFLSKNSKIVYGSFAVTALATMVRSEGIFLFFAISVLFFVRYRKSWKVIPKYIPAIVIFVLILLPMASYKAEIQGDDRIFGRINDAVEIHFLTPEEGSEEWNQISIDEQERINKGSYTGIGFIYTGIENFSKFFVWSLIPVFVLFFPVGIYFVFKNMNFNKFTIIFSGISLAIPVFYAYSVSSLDTRYLFVLYPIFCIVSVFAVETYVKKIKIKNIFLTILIVGILISSILFLEIKKIDAEHEKESFIIAQQVVKNATGINYYSPESQYIKVAEMIKNWPVMPIHTPDGHFASSIIKIDANEFVSLDEFITKSEKEGLSHLVIDIDDNLPNFLLEVFEKEGDYPYLIKEFDSKEEGLVYKVKIFRIDYERFDLFSN